MKEVKKKSLRPLSVSIICIVGILLSINYILDGSIILALLILINLVPGAMSQFFTSFAPILATTFVGFVVSIILLPLSILYIVSFIGVWKVRRWGWVMSLYLSTIIFILAISVSDFTALLIIPIMYILWRYREVFKS